MPTRTFQPIGALPLPDEVLSGWAEIPTTIASDVSGGRLLMDPQIRPLRPLGSARLLGPAVTAWCEPGDIGAAIHAIETAKAGEIVVIDAGANVQTAVVGEHLCGAARRRGVAGLIANGAVRDIAALAAWSDFRSLPSGILPEVRSRLNGAPSTTVSSVAGCRSGRVILCSGMMTA